jgi:hypothetical protein
MTTYRLSPFHKNTDWTLLVTGAISTNKFTIQLIWLTLAETITKRFRCQSFLETHYRPRYPYPRDYVHKIIQQEKSYSNNWSISWKTMEGSGPVLKTRQFIVGHKITHDKRVPSKPISRLPFTERSGSSEPHLWSVSILPAWKCKYGERLYKHGSASTEND